MGINKSISLSLSAQCRGDQKVERRKENAYGEQFYIQRTTGATTPPVRSPLYEIAFGGLIPSKDTQ
jgi:hypothetical protein